MTIGTPLEWLLRWAKGGSSVSESRDDMNIGLIMVTGVGRSGTSAMLNALERHHQAVPGAPGEAPLLNHMMDFLSLYEDEHPDRQYNRATYKVGWSERAFLVRQFVLRAGMGLRPEDVRDREEKYVVAKAFPSKRNLGKFREIFPALAVVHVIRNGIEVVESARRYPPKAHITFEDYCGHWVALIADLAILHHLDRFALVRHELLVSDPDGMIAVCLAQLGLEPDCAPAAFLKSNVVNSSFESAENVVASNLLQGRAMFAWDSWTEAERNSFRQICGPTMTALGYLVPT